MMHKFFLGSLLMFLGSLAAVEGGACDKPLARAAKAGLIEKDLPDIWFLSYDSDIHASNRETLERWSRSRSIRDRFVVLSAEAQHSESLQREIGNLTRKLRRKGILVGAVARLEAIGNNFHKHERYILRLGGSGPIISEVFEAHPTYVLWLDDLNPLNRRFKSLEDHIKVGPGIVHYNKRDRDYLRAVRLAGR